MINFFRKLRKKMADDNKPMKYMRYAIGEIVLVVVGILIALQINNWNENKIQEKKIINALKEVHRELSGDIQESKDVIEYYRSMDSIINIIMTKELTAEDYRGSSGFRYAHAGGYIEELTIENNGFKSLMSYSNNLPQKYQALVESLKNIYIDDQVQLDFSLKISMDAMTEHYSYLAKNTNWYSDFSYNMRITKDAIDFYLNDPYFKNNLNQYHLFVIRNYCIKIIQFLLHAEATYEELTSVLQLKEEVATDSIYYKIKVKDYEHFLGTYKDSVNTVVISLESGKFLYQWNDNKKAKLIPISKNSFIQGDNVAFNSIELDSTGKAVNYIRRFQSIQGTLKKIDKN